MTSLASERHWSLAAAIASITVFGLGIGQFAPLLSLLLEQSGTDATLNGLNASVTFFGVIAGPLLAPRGVRLLGIRRFLLACYALDIALVLAMKVFDSLPAWFALRALLGLIGSSIFTTSEAWINRLAGDEGRGRIIGFYAAALSGGFGLGPLLLSVTGMDGWSPFIANAVISLAATLPLLATGETTRGFGREHGTGTFRMFVRAPLIVGVVAAFGLYESALLSLLPIWGVRSGITDRLAAATLSAVYGGSIVLQIAIGWLSDRWSRLGTLAGCGAVGLGGALLLTIIPATSWSLYGVLFVWGGTAAGLYPLALSMAGDRFTDADLVTVNAAIIIAYGLGALLGPAIGGVAMDIRDPQGLLWLFALVFGALLAVLLCLLARRPAATTDPLSPPGSG